MEATFGSTRFVLKKGDITCEEVDVIVNAANSGLLGGGGVDGAIHHAGGPSILEECKVIRNSHGKCPPGNAVMTGAGDLKAEHVVHAVGPIWSGGEDDELATLLDAYLNSLRIAASHGATSIAFPSISTGAYHYPIEQASLIALGTCKEFALEDSSFSEIRFVLFSDEDLEVYENALGAMK